MFARTTKRLFQHPKRVESPQIPKYLSETYWWAYIHPNAVWFFERQWLVNSILWGNFYKLRDSALAEIEGTSNVLQVACVYGNFTETLAKKTSEVHVVDVAKIQLDNLHQKVGKASNVYAYLQDSSALEFPDDSFESVIIFFLLHEMPEDVRTSTLEHAFRVLKPGGKCVIVDYDKPHWANPFRYVMAPVLHFLEPFALDLWRKPLQNLIPQNFSVQKHSFFGGLYQKLIINKP